MRRSFDPQQPLIRAPLHNKLAQELAMMSEILDALPGVVELVHADLTRDKQPGKGRTGPSGFPVGCMYFTPLTPSRAQHPRVLGPLRRVGTPGYPGAPLTEPDLWASHPALRRAIPARG